MKINLDAPAEEVQIQIIPLIDVIFCILTFFILAALQFTRQQSIDIDLPKASTGTAPQMREMLTVTVSSAGQIFVDKQPVDRNQLYQSLLDYKQRNPNGLMVLNASRVAFYNDVVQILDLMRSVGGDRVALATQPAENNQPPALAPSPTGNPFDIFSNPSPGSTFNPNSPVSPGQFPVAPGTGAPSTLNPGLPTTAPGTGTGTTPGAGVEPGTAPTTAPGSTLNPIAPGSPAPNP